MKLSQLIPAGDYLSYKGDWVTNTAYNVNECVTWTDGHLYEVIKEHTSSDTLAPSNTEYYKAMTATKYQKSTFNLSKASDILLFFNTLSKISSATSAIECSGFDGDGTTIFTLGSKNFSGDIMSLNASKIYSNNNVKEFIVKVTSSAVSFFTKEGNTLTAFTPSSKNFSITKL